MQLPRMRLEEIICKIRDEKTWKSYLVTADQPTWGNSSAKKVVLGGCVVKEHLNGVTKDDVTDQFTELFLLAVKPGYQTLGLGRRLIENLQKLYTTVITFADLRAIGFFSKMGFKAYGEELD